MNDRLSHTKIIQFWETLSKTLNEQIIKYKILKTPL